MICLGCSYELVVYYLTPKEKDDENNEEIEIKKTLEFAKNKTREYEEVNKQDISSFRDKNNIKEPTALEVAQIDEDKSVETHCTNGDIIICILLFILGVALQPFYLFFYFLLMISECSTSFLCFYFYANDGFNF